MQTRRSFIWQALAAPTLSAAPRKARYHQALPAGGGTAEGTPPKGFSWFRLSPGAEGVTLRFRSAPQGDGFFRIAIGNDDREPREIEVRFARSGELCGVIDARFGCEYQPFQLAVDAKAMNRIRREGVRLALKQGEQPLFILQGEPAMRRDAPALTPHLLAAAGLNPVEEFRRRLDSFDSLQQLSWMEGCVLDALEDLRMTRTLERHLDYFFNRPLDSIPGAMWRSSENTLPAAALARHRRGHPAIARTIEYWKKLPPAEAGQKGARSISAEGCYTFAYPCAVVARLQRSAELEELAVRQLRARRDRLIVREQFFLRHYEGDKRTFPGWARGVAWYSLGFARTLGVLADREDLSDLRDELRRVLLWAIARQRPDGLWSCFVEDHSIAPDTSGSSGIAAAIALTVRRGWLPETALAAARKARQALRSRLTPDGFLTGVSQSNKAQAGEALQRSDYRVILQFGMGLLGQLEAALG